MKFVIIFIVVFLVIMYLLTYLRRKKKKDALSAMNSVEKYHQDYTERRIQMQKRRDTALRNTNYVTKFNSGEDYREK